MTMKEPKEIIEETRHKLRDLKAEKMTRKRKHVISEMEEFLDSLEGIDLENMTIQNAFFLSMAYNKLRYNVASIMASASLEDGGGVIF